MTGRFTGSAVRAAAIGVALAAAPSGSARAAVPGPGSTPAAAAPSVEPPPPRPPSFCEETFPAGAERPKVTESFPAKGKSGYALVLDLTFEHGKGETVLPGGLGGKSDSDALHILESAGFYLPDAKGPGAPKLTTEALGTRTKSHLLLSVVALPKKAGRSELELPPLPIAIARASGEVRTLCTAPHRVTVEDPIANTPDAKPKGNPKPKRQLEEWTAAKNAALGGVIALLAGALGAFLYRLWRKRPKVLPPPPPPRPPWEIALEELFDVRIAELVAKGRYAEHFDRVSDAVRRYLGARFGFDGLETTTREAMIALSRVSPRIEVLTEVQLFLEEADLVKFAKLTPAETECRAALEKAEAIVRRTMPVQTMPPPPPGATGAAPSGESARTGGGPA